MAGTVADQLVGALELAGVERIYGIVGDSLNGVTESLRQRDKIQWIHTRHEEAAAFAAGAEAHLTGKLAVCCGSCGPGNLHLINGLFDCHRNRVPVLAIAAHIPSGEIGSGYFQETHPQELFRECSHYVEMVSIPEQLPRLLEQAIRHAIHKRGVGVVVLPGDVALKAASEIKVSRELVSPLPKILPQEDRVGALAAFLNDAEKITILCGSGCAGSHDDLMALGKALQAPMVHAIRGKEHVEWDNPYDVGMTGLIGFSSGYRAMLSCDALLMLGTDFPYRQFYPSDAKIAQVDIDGANLGKRTPIDLGVVGDVKATIQAVLPHIKEGRNSGHLEDCIAHYEEARKDLDELATGRPGQKPIHPQYVAKIVSEQAADDAIFTCDVGTPTIWAARYLTMNGKRRLLGSFNHGSMANAMMQAIGAQAAYPERQVVALAGDGGFGMMMGEFLTLRQLGLPVKVVIFNNGTLGFVEMEMKAAGFLDTGVELDNPDFGKIASNAGLFGARVEDPGELEGALASAFAYNGPAIIDVVTNRLELAMPPQVTTEMAKGFSLYSLRAIINGRGSDLIELARSNLLR